MKFKPLSPNDANFILFASFLDQAKQELYPNGAVFENSKDELDIIIGLYDEETLVGCGALYLFEDYSEAKKVFILPKCRGLGLSKKLMLELERISALSEKFIVKLETGVKQPAAIGLYKSLGYKPIDAFPPYYSHKDHLYFEKNLKC
ncbi:MAG: GNAT family N-acetyltransferase [Halobacteriovorax sp.]|mgnify:CR=1 FL=1|nr:GNAT family N-acetyltransferase [Halobacteriovorax sp.]|tara:strand:- start:24 stop:464 length:441 start_codon:yes stop_codon:yes gene_type:complete